MSKGKHGALTELADKWHDAARAGDLNKLALVIIRDKQLTRRVVDWFEEVEGTPIPFTDEDKAAFHTSLGVSVRNHFRKHGVWSDSNTQDQNLDDVSYSAAYEVLEILKRRGKL
jgi:hypothetical protein